MARLLSLLEHQPVTLGVVGSSPIRVATKKAQAFTYFETCFQGIRNDGCKVKCTEYAAVAHLVERHLAKVEVAGSSPVIRSN